MSDEVYTLGVWRVKDGKQDEFVETWKGLGVHFRSLRHPPGWGTLLQSLEDPQQFYSFGPWRSLDDIEEMRNHPDTPTVIGRLSVLCEEARPGAFKVAASG